MDIVTQYLFLNTRIIIFSCNLLTWNAISLYFLKLNQICIPGMNPVMVCFVFSFLYPVGFSLLIFCFWFLLLCHEPAVDLWFSFLKLSTGFSVKVIPSSENKLRSVLPFQFFLRFCVKLKIFMTKMLFKIQWWSLEDFFGKAFWLLVYFFTISVERFWLALPFWVIFGKLCLCRNWWLFSKFSN